MWNPPGPGLEPMFPALAVRFLFTVSPGKSKPTHFKCKVWWTLVLIVVNKLYYGHHSYTVISAPLLSVSSHSPWPQGNHLSAVVLPFLEFHIGRRQWHPAQVLLPGKSHGWRSLVGCSPWGRWGSDMTERLHFHALEKEMATHSSVLAWRIPGTGEPGGLPIVGSHRVGHDWSDLAAAAHYSI